jgi:hypothetical protein
VIGFYICVYIYVCVYVYVCVIMYVYVYVCVCPSILDNLMFFVKEIGMFLLGELENCPMASYGL